MRQPYQPPQEESKTVLCVCCERRFPRETKGFWIAPPFNVDGLCPQCFANPDWQFRLKGPHFPAPGPPCRCLGCDTEERLLDARIQLQGVVKHPHDGWQARYCESVALIARQYRVPTDALVAAYMKHVGPSIVSVTEGGTT